ncbi:MAG: transposase family protein [Candidatus Eisenbacteria bacterium]|nr:transposase family protein [Candidatus Eisenbacteria bacterium]
MIRGCVGGGTSTSGVECELRYSIRRVECSSCGVKVEQVPWAEHDTGFTKGFEDLIALMAQKTDKTTVARLLRIAWLTVGRVIERVVKRYGGDPSEAPPRAPSDRHR